MARRRSAATAAADVHTGPFLFPFEQDVTRAPHGATRPPRAERDAPARGGRYYAHVVGTFSGRGGATGAAPATYQVSVGDTAL